MRLWQSKSRRMERGLGCPKGCAALVRVRCRAFCARLGGRVWTRRRGPRATHAMSWYRRLHPWRRADAPCCTHVAATLGSARKCGCRVRRDGLRHLLADGASGGTPKASSARRRCRFGPPLLGRRGLVGRRGTAGAGRVVCGSHGCARHPPLAGGTGRRSASDSAPRNQDRSGVCHASCRHDDRWSGWWCRVPPTSRRTVTQSSDSRRDGCSATGDSPSPHFVAIAICAWSSECASRSLPCARSTGAPVTEKRAPIRKE